MLNFTRPDEFRTVSDFCNRMRINCNQTRRAIWISFFLVVFSFPVQAIAKTFYLDAQLTQNCTNNNYSVSNRNCSGSDGMAYKNLQDAISALQGGDTLYIRAGTYIRTTNEGRVGSLNVEKSGTAAQRTVVKNYPGEQPVICTEAGRCRYNPNPGDTSKAVCTMTGGESGSNCYYPNPAITIKGDYIDVIGVKTYGQVLILGSNDSSLQSSDIGGCGPYFNWGYVVFLDSSTNITVKNNKIHHSCWGEAGSGHHASFASYTSRDYVVENNEFYDAWGKDVQIADTRGQSGGIITIRYNVFRASTIRNGGGGFGGIMQYNDISKIYVHNNVFLGVGVGWNDGAAQGTFIYNNTFINSPTDISDWLDHTHYAFNNIFFHSKPSQSYVDIQSSPPFGTINYDYNLYYSTTGDTAWSNLYGVRARTLSEWQNYSGKDLNSVTKNPDFLNPSGNRPEDFKRSSYAGDVTGSPYGTVAGAYETGNEVIGIIPGSTTIDLTPPNPPTGLTVQ